MSEKHNSDKAVENDAVVSYMNTYKFPLKGKLDTTLKVISPS